MKKDIHPEYMTTKVHCNGCNTEFETRSTVDKITVEICSNCHPFYTGKQKLVDVAGRVDRFKAKQAAASTKKSTRTTKSPRAEKAKPEQPDSTEQLQELKRELDKQPASTPAADAKQ